MAVAQISHWNWWQTVSWVQNSSLDDLDSLTGFALTQKTIAKLTGSFPAWTRVTIELPSFGAAKSISSFGLLQPDNHRVLIDDIDWIGGTLDIMVEASLQNGARVWHALVFESADVMRCWPAEPAVPARIASPNAIAEPAQEKTDESTVPPSGATSKLATQPTETFLEWSRRQFEADASQEQAFQELSRAKKFGRFPHASREQLRVIYRAFDPSRGPGRRPRRAGALD